MGGGRGERPGIAGPGMAFDRNRDVGKMETSAWSYGCGGAR